MAKDNGEDFKEPTETRIRKKRESRPEIDPTTTKESRMTDKRVAFDVQNRVKGNSEEEMNEGIHKAPPTLKFKWRIPPWKEN